MVNSGTGREWKISIPKVREREGNEKIHSQNSGTGREWKNPFPKFGKGNQRPPFLGMTGNGNGNGNNILFTFLDFFLPGSTLKFFSLTLCPKIFSWLPHMYSDSQKNLGQKLNVKFLNFSRWHLTWRSLKFWKTRGILLPSVYGSTLKYLTLTFCPNFFSWLPHTYSDSQNFFCDFGTLLKWDSWKEP